MSIQFIYVENLLKAESKEKKGSTARSMCGARFRAARVPAQAGGRPHDRRDSTATDQIDRVVDPTTTGVVDSRFVSRVLCQQEGFVAGTGTRPVSFVLVQEGSLVRRESGSPLVHPVREVWPS